MTQGACFTQINLRIGAQGEIVGASSDLEQSVVRQPYFQVRPVKMINSHLLAVSRNGAMEERGGDIWLLHSVSRVSAARNES